MDPVFGAGARTLVDSRDPDEAAEQIGTSYCPHRVKILRVGSGFHACQREATVGDIAVHSLRYGSDIAIEPVPLGDWVLVSSPIRGAMAISSGRTDRTVGVGERW